MLKENNHIVGILSLMLDDYYKRSDKSRIRIFHTLSATCESYTMLFNRAIQDRLMVSKIEVFLSDSNIEFANHLRDLGFEYSWTSYVMIRDRKDLGSHNFPKGFSLKPFRPTIDEVNYLNVRNEAFKSLRGSDTPITKEMVIEQYNDIDLLENGMLILWENDIPVGIVRVVKEIEDAMKYSFISPIAIIPEYQGMGLGKNLLYAGINVGIENGLNNSMLVVSANNSNALKLYKAVGYEQNMSVSCYEYMINNI